MTKIYVIHGWTYNLDKWADITIELKMRDLEPVFLKVPGLVEPSDKVWNMNGYVKWLGEKLQGEVNPIVVGHSNGGRIALSYIQKHPGHLKQLILIDSAGVAHHQTGSIIKLFILKILAKIGKVFSFIPGIRKLFYKLIGAQDYLNAKPNMRETMQNMLKADNKIKLSHIRLPVTIIWGREDTITPLSDGQKLKEGIKNSKLFIVDNARHAPMATHSVAVADLIAEAVKEQL